MDALDVTAIIVTRGDCDLNPIIDSMIFGHVLVWSNQERVDWGAYGRYAAIELAHSEVIYFQDDDCVIPEDDQRRLVDAYEPGVLTALMPPERTDYTDTVLIGWGAIFDRELPRLAFAKWAAAGHDLTTDAFKIVGCDFVFPMLTPWKRLDGHHRDLPHAHAPNRTWASYPDYATVKAQFLTEARAIR